MAWRLGAVMVSTSTRREGVYWVAAMAHGCPQTPSLWPRSLARAIDALDALQMGRGNEPEAGHDVHDRRTDDADGPGFQRSQRLRRAVPHAPLRQALVQMVEQRPRQASERPQRREQQELPDLRGASTSEKKRPTP